MQYLTRDKILFLAKNFYYRIMIFWDAVQDSFYGALLNFVHSLWVGGISPLWKKVLYVTHTHACMYIMHACIHAACVQVYSDIRSGTSMHTRTSTHTWSIHAPPTTHKYWTSKHKKAFACFFDRLSHLVYLLCLLQDWKLYVPLEEYYTFVNSIEARYKQ